jgi:hypothetical protein
MKNGLRKILGMSSAFALAAVLVALPGCNGDILPTEAAGGEEVFLAEGGAEPGVVVFEQQAVSYPRFNITLNVVHEPGWTTHVEIWSEESAFPIAIEDPGFEQPTREHSLSAALLVSQDGSIGPLVYNIYTNPNGWEFRPLRVDAKINARYRYSDGVNVRYGPFSAQHTVSLWFEHAVAAARAGPATSPVYTFELDPMLIEGASANVVRTKNGVNFRVDTNSLLPGHAYTLWVVIFNEPGQCLTAPGTCTPPDLFNAAAKPDMLYGAGTVAGGSGRATFAGRTQVGDVSGSVQAPVGLLSNGLIDPFGAEFHLVVRDHGPLIPAFMPDMIQTLAGGCTDTGLPAVGAPSPWNDYALSEAYGGEFGRLGPNHCLDVQFSILSP